MYLFLTLSDLKRFYKLNEISAKNVIGKSLEKIVDLKRSFSEATEHSCLEQRCSKTVNKILRGNTDEVILI